ncbi:PAS domain-containing protein [Oceanibaculum sp.]|uniref:PAS domain-containing protein n=1 Tax=Oceanibaculum sp. TaxID=1903597 RepID=UPI00258CC9BA|nr:PAS domain-containing protein [Oceanibaculum sp.]MCH2395582.1 PAS domain-containing protein [Oceanibaculum sp.]
MREAIQHERLRQLYDYWEGKRGNRLMPARTDIDPVEIPGLLPNLILIDVERGERNRYRFRLYGTEVCANRGADLPGR